MILVPQCKALQLIFHVDLDIRILVPGFQSLDETIGDRLRTCWLNYLLLSITVKEAEEVPNLLCDFIVQIGIHLQMMTPLYDSRCHLILDYDYLTTISSMLSNNH